MLDLSGGLATEPLSAIRTSDALMPVRARACRSQSQHGYSLCLGPFEIPLDPELIRTGIFNISFWLH